MSMRSWTDNNDTDYRQADDDAYVRAKWVEYHETVASALMTLKGKLAERRRQRQKQEATA